MPEPSVAIEAMKDVDALLPDTLSGEARAVPGSRMPERIGHYRIDRVWDETAPTPAYFARELSSGREVALKQVGPDGLITPGQREPILEEARKLAAIFSEYLPRILHAQETDDAIYLVTELPEGETLQARLQREHRLPRTEALRIAREIALALMAAHARGLIHGNITPANVWLLPSGRSQLFHFELGRNSVDRSILDHLEVLSGTPGYLSPEQASGEAVTFSADLFGLGCVLYQMITGERPFRGDTPRALLRAAVFDSPRPPREIDPEIPSSINELIQDLLAKLPGSRPASARSVAERLAEVLAPKRKAAPAEESLTETPPASSTIRTRLQESTARITPLGPALPSVVAEETPRPAPWQDLIIPTLTQSETTGHLTVLPAPSASETAASEASTFFGRHPWLEHVLAAIFLIATGLGLYAWWKYSQPRTLPAPAVPAPAVVESSENQ